jgi:hypothetical protein
MDKKREDRVYSADSGGCNHSPKPHFFVKNTGADIKAEIVHAEIY